LTLSPSPKLRFWEDQFKEKFHIYPTENDEPQRAGAGSGPSSSACYGETRQAKAILSLGLGHFTCFREKED